MANLKLQDYEDSGDSFTFPYNPNTVTFSTAKFIDKRNIPYWFAIMGFTSPIKSAITIGINGHFDGANKNSNYRSLVKKINDPILLRLYFENSHDKFYLCTGSDCQKVPSGARPIITDYVGSFISPFGVLFDDNQQSGSNSSAHSNDGDMVTPIEKITGSVTNGVLVRLKDKHGNGFKFTPTVSGIMTYYFVKMRALSGITILTEYMYVEVAGVPQIITNADTSGDLMLKMEPGDSLYGIFLAGSIVGITPTFYFRNGWASD